MRRLVAGMNDKREVTAVFPVGTVVRLAHCNGLMIVVDFDLKRRETCVAWPIANGSRA